MPIPYQLTGTLLYILMACAVCSGFQSDLDVVGCRVGRNTECFVKAQGLEDDFRCQDIKKLTNSPTSSDEVTFGIYFESHSFKRFSVLVYPDCEISKGLRQIHLFVHICIDPGRNGLTISTDTLTCSIVGSILMISNMSAS